MSFFDAYDLAQVRADQVSARPTSIAVIRPPTDRTARDIDPATAAATLTTTGLILPGGSEGEVAADGRVVTITGVRVCLPYDLTIQPRDYLRGAGRVLRVVKIVGPWSAEFSAHLCVFCEEVA